MTPQTKQQRNGPVNEVFFSCKKQSKNMYLSYYPSSQERVELISELGDAAYLLYDYYLRLASFTEKVEPTDAHAADYFSWDEAKVQRIRLKLTKAGWVRFSRSTHSDGRKSLIGYLGKEAVENSLSHS